MSCGFDGKSLGNPPLERRGVNKDVGTFDQLTVAAITPRAIVKAVKKALQYYREHREALFAEAKAPVQDTAIPGRMEGNNPGEERQP